MNIGLACWFVVLGLIGTLVSTILLVILCTLFAGLFSDLKERIREIRISLPAMKRTLRRDRTLELIEPKQSDEP